jgi:signal transduction histidine kinase
MVKPRAVKWRDGQAAQWPAIVLFSAGLCLATGALTFLAYFATREWTRGTDLLLRRRAAEALALVGAAINRDMKGAWTTLLVPINEVSIEDDPYELLQSTAQVFARFPYPESVFLWKNDGGDGAFYLFNRANRRPPWDREEYPNGPFPVVLRREGAALRSTLAELRKGAAAGSAFASVNTTVEGRPYQIVAHLFFDPGREHQLVGIVGFTVNIDWLTREYFRPLLSEVARIGGGEEPLAFTVTDNQGRLVANIGAPPAGALAVSRSFPLLFLDPAVLSYASGRGPAVANWDVHVGPTPDNTLLTALSSARRTFLLLAAGAAVSIIALLLTIRAVAARAAVASMKSDFVSAVTHELKTPLSIIRLVGDTLSQGRYSSADTVQEYARLLSQESARLTRSIDNLLLYAKYSDGPHQSASLLPTDVGDLVDAALEQFRHSLAQQQFQLTVDVPHTLPRVLADRRALIQVLENLIDNAIKYSSDVKSLTIGGRSVAEGVEVTFEDRGVGIDPEDLPHVFERFYRGRNTSVGGSGLGLAIARRILTYHGGSISARNSAHGGTVVSVSLVMVGHE